MKHLKVEGHTHLYRDPQTNSIINKNSSEYDEYINKKFLREKEDQKIDNIESDLAKVKSDLEEIKSLLKGLSK